jgi:hypothetical protein
MEVDVGLPKNSNPIYDTTPIVVRVERSGTRGIEISSTKTLAFHKLHAG